MPGTVILSHGSDSAPDATKVSALASVADELGWRALRPDYRVEDKLGHAGSVQPRIEKLIASAQDTHAPLVLAGSSMGAFVSGLASLRIPCAGLFLVALPLRIPRWSENFDMAAVPAMLVHGFNDEVCPVSAAARFANARHIPTLLLPGGHRLAAQVPAICQQFRLFLEQLSG